MRLLLASAQLSSMTASGKSWSTKLRGMPSSKVREMYSKMGGGRSGKGKSGGGGGGGGGGEAAASTSRVRGDSTESDVDDGELQQSLRELLGGLKLKSKALDTALTQGLEWCREEGYESIAMIQEVHEEEPLLRAMQLKPGQVKVLQKRLAEAAAAVPPLGGKQMSARL